MTRDLLPWGGREVLGEEQRGRVRATVEELAGRYASLESLWRRRVRSLTHGRVAAFLAAAASFFSPLWLSLADRIAAPLTGAFALGFLVLVVLHHRADRRVRWYATLKAISDEAQARRRRAWSALPLYETRSPPPAHPYGEDLDLFGAGSLFHLLYVPGTPRGGETLRSWLLERPPRQTTVARQEAVRELARSADFRMQVAASGRLAEGLTAEALAAFEDWARSSPQFLTRPELVWASWAIPVATLVFAALQLAGTIRLALWLIPLLAGIAVALRTSQRSAAVIRRASLKSSSISHLVSSLELIAAASFAGSALRDIQARLRPGGGAARGIRRLEAITRLGEVRYSGLLHSLLDGLFLWDLHVALLLERWCRVNGSLVRSWLDALGEMEALGSLAELADGHPQWAFPLVRDAGAPPVVARGLAHPLLPPAKAVANDVRVDPGRFLFVTGSNMSGKSTLVRAIGVNAILARIGAPVCAASMELGESEIFTYVHVRDSLLDGVSMFMAGLLRLKALLTDARAAQGNGGSLLFLLDEPLQGTNAAERQLAIRRILASLVALNASGAITSHDLSLVDREDLARSAVPVHFQERVDTSAKGPVLVFDYRLRPGVCSSTNAIQLLDIMGL